MDSVNLANVAPRLDPVDGDTPSDSTSADTMVVGAATDAASAGFVVGGPDPTATDASETASVVAAMLFNDTVEESGISAPVAGGTAPASDETAIIGFGGIDLAGAVMASGDMGTAAGLASGAFGGGGDSGDMGTAAGLASGASGGGSDFGASGSIAGDGGAASALVGGGGWGAVTNDGTIGGAGATPAQVQQAMDESGSLTVTGGTGITVGVMSDSFNNLGGAATDESDGALPIAADVDVLLDKTSGGTDEGRSMMQIVHDIAPGADLDFYTADNGEGSATTVGSFAYGILALANAGCKVICDDVSYFDEPFFQTDAVAAAIATVEAEGVTFLTSAGNQAAAAYQSAWTPIASTTFDGQTLTDTLNFGTVGSPNPVQTLVLGTGAGSSLPVILQWNQPYGNLTSNLEMFIFSGGSFLGYESNKGLNTPGSLSGNPDIQVNLTTGHTYQIAIENVSGSDPTLIKDMIYNDSDPSNVSLSGANAGTVFGHHMSTDAIAVGAVDTANTPAFGVTPPVSEDFSSSGTGTELWFDANGNLVSGAPEDLSPVLVSGVDDIDTSVLTPFFGTSAATPSVAAVVALMLQANPNLTFAQIEAILQESVVTMSDTEVAGAGLVQADVAVADAIALLCFSRGTLIQTERGEVAVEDLAIGDTVMTQSGWLRPIKWIGRRAYDPRFVAGNRAVLPIRVEAGALGDGVPARDLSLSPEHALHIDGLLVPARLLVNGITIRQVESVEQLEYFHIELDSHDVIFADGAPAESFGDTANRGMFHNAAEFDALYPEEPPQGGEFCAPRVAEDSAELTAIRTALLERATALGRVTRDPGLHLIADGNIVHAASGGGGIYRFTVAAGTRRAALASRSAVPAEVYPFSLDGRALGVPVERIALGDAGLRVEIGHNSAALGSGFHDDEAAQRWSDGQGCLPEGILACFAGDIAITVHLAASALIYPADPSTGVADATGAPPAAESPGPGGLRGYIDVIRPDRICGWAMIAGDPETPVALDIYVGGTLRGRTVANRFRADLQSLGSGRHAFEFHPPMGLHFAPGSIEVRHSSDGAALPRSTDLTLRLTRAG